jgi:hypothetical protein
MTHGHWIGEKVRGPDGETREPDILCEDRKCDYPQVLPQDMDTTIEKMCACCGEPTRRPKYAFSKSGWEDLCLRCSWADSSCPKGQECLGITNSSDLR